MSGWRGRCLDAALYWAGLTVTWAFPAIVRVLALIDYQTVSPERYPEGR